MFYEIRPTFCSWSGLDGSGAYKVYAAPEVVELVETTRREPGCTVRELRGLRGLQPGRAVVDWSEYQFDVRGGTFDGLRAGTLALTFDGIVWTPVQMDFGSRLERRADEPRRNAIREWVGLPQVRWGCLSCPEDVARAKARLLSLIGTERPAWATALLDGRVPANVNAMMDWNPLRADPTEIQRAGKALADLLGCEGWVTR